MLLKSAINGDILSLTLSLVFVGSKHYNFITVFPRIIAGGDYFYFRTERGQLFEGRRLFEGGDYFKYFLCPIYLVLLYD